MGSSPEDGTATSLGGKSLLVDGFHAAQILKEEEPGLFDILASVEVPCHASGNKGITIAPDKLYPVLEYDAKRNMMHRIRWNNDDRGVVPLGNRFSAMQWYEAAMKWNEILTRKELEYWVQLEPGNVLSKHIGLNSARLPVLTLRTKFSTIGECCTEGVLSRV